MSKNTESRLHESIMRFSEILSPQEIREIIAIQDQPLPTGIRINPLKSDPHLKIKDLASRYGWCVQSLPYCENGWTIQQSIVSPGLTIEHRMGQYYIQDAASMVPVSLFNLETPQPLVLDLAASPGGKTTHLIDRTNDRGFILANDASKGRIPALRSVLVNWGAANTIVTNFPGEKFGAWYPETFDLVLLDAPCSMENLRPAPNHPLRETTQTERSRLQERQINLLISGLQALKIGGQIVYATCSLAPEEDEAVIDTTIQKFPDALKILDVSEKVPNGIPGLAEFNHQTFHKDLAGSLRLWPHLTGMSGFFCALMQKTAPVKVHTEPAPSRDFSRTDLGKVSEELQNEIFEFILLTYGFELLKITTDQNLALFQRHDQLFLIPKRYLEHFINLPYTWIGLSIGHWNDQILTPSHEFISRFGHLFTRGIIQIDHDLIAQWCSGRDIRHPETDLQPVGQYLLVTDKSRRNLGLGKLLSKRLRNMLPRQSI